MRYRGRTATSSNVQVLFPQTAFTRKRSSEAVRPYRPSWVEQPTQIGLEQRELLQELFEGMRTACALSSASLKDAERRCTAPYLSKRAEGPPSHKTIDLGTTHTGRTKYPLGGLLHTWESRAVGRNRENRPPAVSAGEQIQ